MLTTKNRSTNQQISLLEGTQKDNGNLEATEKQYHIQRGQCWRYAGLKTAFQKECSLKAKFSQVCTST